MESPQRTQPKSINLISPFPIGALPRAYEWHQHTSTVVCGETLTKEEFCGEMEKVLLQGGVRSWMVVERTPQVIRPAGMVIFSPVWRGWELVDGEIHIALARSVWGGQTVGCLADEIIPELFNSIPSLLRLSGSTPSHYRPGVAMAQRLGFTIEGRLRNAVRIGNKVRNITLTGLTREDWENKEKV